MTEPIVYRYRGTKSADGRPLEYLTGIPARSLTQADVDALEPSARAALADSPIYSKQEPKADKSDAKADTKPATKAADTTGGEG